MHERTNEQKVNYFNKVEIRDSIFIAHPSWAKLLIGYSAYIVLLIPIQILCDRRESKA